MRILIFVFALAVTPFLPAAAQEWQACDSGQERISCINTVYLPSGETIIAGTEKGRAGVSRDGGLSWDFHRCADGYGKRINAFCYEKGLNTLFAAADNGIFLSADCGRTWQRVFKAGGGRECLDLQATPEGVCALTGAGIFFSLDGKVWRKDCASFSPRAIIYSSSGSMLFALSGNALYARKVPGGRWERKTGYAPSEVPDEGEDGPATEEAQVRTIRGKPLSLGEQGTIFAADGRRVLRSADQGQTWEELPLPLNGRGSLSLLCFRQELLAAAGQEVLIFAGGRWEQMGTGLGGVRISALAGSAGAVLAGTDRGIFGMPAQALAQTSGGVALHGIGRYLAGEPAIAAVQKAALEFADAGPEKILAWRRQARKKAWLPHFSCGLDRETGDLWHWESGSTTRADDDCLRRGKDSINWDVSLTWDLGDLIWNDAQTAIDSRSKLNAELRAEVLDEVTKLYFERARLKMEIDGLTLEERKKRFEKLVKLEETTALLDGLTGGFYRAFQRGNGLKRLANDGSF